MHSSTRGIHYGSSPHFQFQIPRITPGIKFLLLGNIFFFLLSLLFKRQIWTYFGLVSGAVFGKGMIWQFATYTFVHASVLHLLFNLLVLWMFGTEVEELWGTKRFLTFYFGIGASSGFLAWLMALGSPTIIVGASGAVFGVFTAYALLFPERLVTLLLFFVMPVTLKAKHLVLIFGGIEFLMLLADPHGGVARFAHLGGILFSYLYIRGATPLLDMGRSAFRKKRRPKLRILVKTESDREKFFQNEIDPILDKIASKGMKSLTRKERQILKESQEKLKGGKN